MLSTLFNVVVTLVVVLVIAAQLLRLFMKPKDVSKIPNLYENKKKYQILPEDQEVVRGEDLNPMDGNAVVVCLSAVSCPPCSRAQAVLSDLQKKNPNVTIFQCYGGEDQVTVAEKVISMEKQYRTEMNHIITVIDPEIFQNYARTFGVFGIPHAVVLDKGKAVWSGNPLGGALPPVLAALNKKYSNGADSTSDEESGEDDDEEEEEEEEGQQDDENKKLLQ